jgi:hypothetical protein
MVVGRALGLRRLLKPPSSPRMLDFTPKASEEVFLDI